MPACGNDSCHVSSGICGAITFGSGELDDNGYWETPCDACALSWHKRAKKGEVSACDVWPIPPEPLTCEQIVQVLEVPLGGIKPHKDPIVTEERGKLYYLYCKLRKTNNHHRSDKVVLRDIADSSVTARTAWLRTQLDIRGD